MILLLAVPLVWKLHLCLSGLWESLEIPQRIEPEIRDPLMSIGLEDCTIHCHLYRSLECYASCVSSEVDDSQYSDQIVPLNAMPQWQRCMPC
ncbi:hypothetical protein FB446DRAFT_438141 [Lentinula raphanica]|nr:hypothetical protein FB446DRAFT_438141 [Lentinula raphanica]